MVREIYFHFFKNKFSSNFQLAIHFDILGASKSTIKSCPSFKSTETFWRAHGMERHTSSKGRFQQDSILKTASLLSCQDSTPCEKKGIPPRRMTPSTNSAWPLSLSMKKFIFIPCPLPHET